MQAAQTTKLRYFDIAANLSHGQFAGFYKGKHFHQNDLEDVLQRAKDVGCDRLLITGSSLKDSKTCLEISQKSDKYYCTVGVHPTRVMDVEKFGGQQRYFQDIEELITKCGDKCVAIGECGLDYDRLMCAEKEFQLKHFPIHFDLAQKFNKPLYLHDRNSEGDFCKLMKENRHKFSTGIVHTFTGNEEELKQYLSLDLYIGVSGCSLKKKKNLEVAKQIPLDKIMLETDCPYCEIFSSHDSFPLVKTQFPSKFNDKYQKGFLVKGRNEPCKIVQVAEVVAAIKKVSVQEVSEAAYQNTMRVFNLKDEKAVTGSEVKSQ